MPGALLLLCALARATPEPARLDSGLQVGLEVVHDDGHVQLELRILAGAAEDPPGRSGLAHLAEHTALLPAASAPSAPPIPDTEIEAVTTHDATRFLVRVAPEHLDPALQWVRDTLSPREPPLPRAFELERARVAKEALRGSREEPALRGMALYPPGHPYHRPAAGIDEELRGLSLEDATGFVRRWYRPDRAVLALAGELPVDAMARVQAILGEIAAPGEPAPVPASPPARAAAWPRRWWAPEEDRALLLLAPLGAAPAGDGPDLLALGLEQLLRDPPWRADARVLRRRLGDELVIRLHLAPPRGLLTRGPEGGWAARARQAERRIRHACQDAAHQDASALYEQLAARAPRSPAGVAERLAQDLSLERWGRPEGELSAACGPADQRAWLALGLTGWGEALSAR